MKTPSKYQVAPEYPRIPHLSKDISNMTHDDIQVDKIPLPIDGVYQEKIDGANCGMSWNDGPLLRNRDHILKKGYTKIKTPAKKQFVPAWNWLHEHEDDIKEIIKLWESPITIYGEWMLVKHSLDYTQLTDWFIAYDIWSLEDEKFLSPELVSNLLSQTNIQFIKSYKKVFTDVQEIIDISETQSDYRDGVREGIVIKTSNGFFCENMYKIVNKHFTRRDDFNDEMIKNKLI